VRTGNFNSSDLIVALADRGTNTGRAPPLPIFQSPPGSCRTSKGFNQSQFESTTSFQKNYLLGNDLSADDLAVVISSGRISLAIK
jgi:hypothetical protein